MSPPSTKSPSPSCLLIFNHTRRPLSNSLLCFIFIIIYQRRGHSSHRVLFSIILTPILHSPLFSSLFVTFRSDEEFGRAWRGLVARTHPNTLISSISPFLVCTARHIG